MEENKESIWHRNLNLVFVYVVVFLFGLVTIYIMTTILNAKVQEINESTYGMVEQNM